MVFYAAGDQVASSLPSGIQIPFDFVMDSVCTENKYLKSVDTSSVARRKSVATCGDKRGNEVIIFSTHQHVTIQIW